MSIVQIVVALLGVLPALIKAVETIFGAGNGAGKKAAVVQLIPLALGLASDLSKGGQKATIDTIAGAPTLGPAIDALAGMIFPSGTTIETLKPAD